MRFFQLYALSIESELIFSVTEKIKKYNKPETESVCKFISDRPSLK